MNSNYECHIEVTQMNINSSLLNLYNVLGFLLVQSSIHRGECHPIFEVELIQTEFGV